jgi:hypothetical protein
MWRNTLSTHFRRGEFVRIAAGRAHRIGAADPARRWHPGQGEPGLLLWYDWRVDRSSLCLLLTVYRSVVVLKALLTMQRGRRHRPGDRPLDEFKNPN